MNRLSDVLGDEVGGGAGVKGGADAFKRFFAAHYGGVVPGVGHDDVVFIASQPVGIVFQPLFQKVYPFAG